ncbi:MAG: DUF6561 domain-containing protein [Nitrosarchaeum sp.]|nr:DUF6561 domain-containing protein [Nitrosarchaeum sp.]
MKCLLLKVDTVLITEIIEVGSELGEPDCKLINPYEFFDVDTMKPWPEITNQSELMIHSNSILTIVDPTPEIIEKYLELTS